MLMSFNNILQKQPSRVVLKKRCSENMQQVYRRAPMPKCDFNKVACNFIEITLWHGCSPVNLLHIFRTPFLKSTSGRLRNLSALSQDEELHYHTYKQHETKSNMGNEWNKWKMFERCL